MNKVYQYIGPDELLKLLNTSNKGTIIHSQLDLKNWIDGNRNLLSIQKMQQLWCDGIG
ncbi:MAG: hypothetical protein JXR36_03330 [Bacteroidales bacterium]|nr:hypothetical protein [Bacteroidales bacterium]